MNEGDDDDDEEEEVTSDGYPEPSNNNTCTLLSQRPPQEFLSKMKRINEQQQSQQDTFGMFSKPLYAWKGLPCSLHFENANPSQQAKIAMKILHDQLLGNKFGIKQGEYGAGGGGVHILYLGGTRSSANSNSDDEESDDDDDDVLSFPNINTLLDMMNLSEGYKPHSLRWMITADPLHQQLFRKTRDNNQEEIYPSTLSLDGFVNVLSTHNQINTRRIIPINVPNHVVSNYPCLQEGLILFLLPRFKSIHDGECLMLVNENNVPLCPTACAFHNNRINNRNENENNWHIFSQRPDTSIDIILQETTLSAANINIEPGDICESPVFCFFQLEKTAEVMALVQWDYRD